MVVVVVVVVMVIVMVIMILVMSPWHGLKRTRGGLGPHTIGRNVDLILPTLEAQAIRLASLRPRGDGHDGSFFPFATPL